MTEEYRIPFIPNSPRQIGEISQSIAQELSKDEEGTEKVEVFNTYRSNGKNHQWLGFNVRLTYPDNTFKEYVYKITGNMAQLQ